MDNNGDSPLHDMQAELENVQSLIQLTKEDIDALNERFSKFKPSPKIYLEEYQDLTSKLHHFKITEQNLVEKMQLIQEQNEVSQASIFFLLAATSSESILDGNAGADEAAEVVPASTLAEPAAHVRAGGGRHAAARRAVEGAQPSQFDVRHVRSVRVGFR